MSASFCWHCGHRMQDGVEVLIGGNAVRMHRSCAERQRHRYVYPPAPGGQTEEAQIDMREPPAERELDFN